MKSLIIVDGEGISEIENHFECWPCYSNYWKIGRKKFTSDAVAAAKGLLDAGISEVVILDGHGTGAWPNLLADKLPEKARLFEKKTDKPSLFDSWFYVGGHARCGTQDGFVSHTNVPYLRVAVNGSTITETHAAAMWMGMIPLGVTGDAALDPQLDNFLSRTPFLTVKRSSSRFKTVSLYSNGRSFAAIRSFAKACALKDMKRDSRKVNILKTFEVSFSLDPEMAKTLSGKHFLKEKSPSVLTLRKRGWTKEVDFAYEAVTAVAAEPFMNAWGDLDLSSEAMFREQKQASLKRLRTYIENWVHADISSWQV